MAQETPHQEADIAIVVGGSERVFEEFDAARDMVQRVGRNFETFCVNDMIAKFPEHIDHAVTLHPEKIGHWLSDRCRHNRPGIGTIWAHRPNSEAQPLGISHSLTEWQGSVGLFAVKVARLIGYTHVIVAGVPMDTDGGHFHRGRDWNNAHGFRRGWISHMSLLRPYVRSMSGWTQEQLGAPSSEWLTSTIPDNHVVRPDISDLRA